MSGGVPLSQLQCPTCGQPFDHTLKYDEGESLIQATALLDITHTEPPYLLCWGGHKWTLKTIWRSVDREDEVLLDRFVGLA